MKIFQFNNNGLFQYGIGIEGNYDYKKMVTWCNENVGQGGCGAGPGAMWIFKEYYYDSFIFRKEEDRLMFIFMFSSAGD